MATELEQKLKPIAWHIGDFTNDLDEWTELCDWASTTEGMCATLVVKCGQEPRFQVEGLNVATINPTMNSYVIWNGYVLQHLSEQEFSEQHT